MLIILKLFQVSLNLNDYRANLYILYHHQHHCFCFLLSSFKLHVASSGLGLCHPIN